MNIFLVTNFPVSLSTSFLCSHPYMHSVGVYLSLTLQPADSCRARQLESCAQLLLFKFNHLRGRIKQVADKYLTKLIDK